MWAKVDELKEAVREMNATKATLRSTFMQAASSLGGAMPKQQMFWTYNRAADQLPLPCVTIEVVCKFVRNGPCVMDPTPWL